MWQFAAKHAADYLRGNHTPALVEWAIFLNYLRSACEWDLIIILDGMDNIHKTPENNRRKAAAENAKRDNNLIGQIRNTPEYIAKAGHVCAFMNINYHLAYEEADPQVVYESVSHLKQLVPVTSDSDLLAYSSSGGLVLDNLLAYGVRKIIIVKAYAHEWFRVIDLDADVEEGEYPVLDMRRKHGIIAFQLFAGCTGCDFTNVRSGISGIGDKTFIKLVTGIDDEGIELNANSLADAIWNNENDIAMKNGFESADDVEKHLQHIVDVYSNGNVYDKRSNVINMMTGCRISESNEQSKQHMAGKVNSRTREEYSEDLVAEIDKMDCSQLLKVSAADTSTIRGAHLPANKTANQCTMPILRDFVGARGGKMTGNKNELVLAVKRYQLIEEEVTRTFVDRNPNPNGILYAKVDTSGTKSIGQQLDDLLVAVGGSSNDVNADIKSLVQDTHRYYSEGLFDDKYDNISRVAPELKEGVIYKQYANIGSSITQKNIGDALRRCWYGADTTYHAMAHIIVDECIDTLTRRGVRI